MYLEDHADQLDRESQVDQESLQKKHRYMIVNRDELCFTLRWIFRIIGNDRDEGRGI